MACCWPPLPLTKTRELLSCLWLGAIRPTASGQRHTSPMTYAESIRLTQALVMVSSVRSDITTALEEAWSAGRQWTQGTLAGETTMAALWVHDPLAVDLGHLEAKRESRLILELMLKAADTADEMPWTRGIPWSVSPASMSILEMAATKRRLLTDCATRTLLPDDLVTVCCGILVGAIDLAAPSQWPADAMVS